MAITLMYASPSLPVLGHRDEAITTKKEVEVGGHQTIMVHSAVVASISSKMAYQLADTPPGEVVQVGGWFEYATLIHTLTLLYQGYLVVGEEEASDVEDMICMMRAAGHLYRVQGNQAGENEP